MTLPFQLSLLRSGAALAGVRGLAAVLLGGPVAAPPPGATGLPPEIAAMLAAQPKWSSSVSLDAMYGYRDNLLLSYAGEERSAFARGAVELMLLRVPVDRFDYSLYVQADRTRFLSSPTVDHEARAWIASDFGYRISEAWKVSVPVTGYYSDRVQDVSDSEVTRFVAQFQETGVMIGPTVRWTLHPAWWLEAQGLGQRRTYDDHADDGRVGEGAVRLGWIPHERVEFRLSAMERWRDFDSRAQYSAAGRELVGTKLKIAEREGEFRADLKWDQAGQWQTTTRACALTYRDNGSGYFSFRERKVAQDLAWKSTQWSVRLGGVARRVDYVVQSVGLGIRPPARLKDGFSAELRVERKLTPRWTLLAGFEWERSRSNDPIASYVVNEGLLGVRWNWEK